MISFIASLDEQENNCNILTTDFMRVLLILNKYVTLFFVFHD